MNEQPIGRLDPEKLKHERKDVDLGTDEETGFDQVRKEQNQPGTVVPTSGVTPPAR